MDITDSDHTNTHMTIQVKNAIKKWSLAIVIMIIIEYLCHFIFNLGLMSVSVFIYSCIGSFVIIILANLFREVINTFQNKLKS